MENEFGLERMEPWERGGGVYDEDETDEVLDKMKNCLNCKHFNGLTHCSWNWSWIDCKIEMDSKIIGVKCDKWKWEDSK